MLRMFSLCLLLFLLITSEADVANHLLNPHLELCTCE